MGQTTGAPGWPFRQQSRLHDAVDRLIVNAAGLTNIYSGHRHASHSEPLYLEQGVPSVNYYYIISNKNCVCVDSGELLY